MSDAVRVHFAYRHIDQPWGGANNFIRALYHQLERDSHFVLTQNIEDDCDVLFMNQLGKGPGGQGDSWRLKTIERLVKQRSKSIGCRLVVRAVNLHRHAFRMGIRNRIVGTIHDRDVIRLLRLADTAIFQSDYQREVFLAGGYDEARDVVIHNGASDVFWVDRPAHPPLEDNLRLVSSTASPRSSKRHALIARMSEIAGVEVVHFGNWPKGLNSRKVNLLGMRTHEEMKEVYARSHYFLHSAIKDPCPNAIFEAVCSGLPVIYNPGPGSSKEIVKDNGIALDETDLESTIGEARKRLAELREEVLLTRHSYTASSAVEGYCRVFKRGAVGDLS